MKEFMRYVFLGGCLGLLLFIVLVVVAFGAMVEDYKEQIDNISLERDYWKNEYRLLTDEYCNLQGAMCDK